MDTHHPAIAAAEEAAQAEMDRRDARAVRSVIEAMSRLKGYPLGPWVIATLAAGVRELAEQLANDERDCARRYLDDLVDDMKGFHRDRC